MPKSIRPSRCTAVRHIIALRNVARMSEAICGEPRISRLRRSSGLHNRSPAMPSQWEYRGILPAMQLPFDQHLAIDEPELRRFAGWLAGHNGIGGLVTNGHT